MRYPDSFLERLRNAARVSAVVGARIPLRRHGREFMALCPFHKEKTPSFTINDEKGFYHCFGCGAHGDAIGFIKEYEGVGYKEAIEKLAGELGIAVPKPSREAQVQERQRRDLQAINELACRWFEAELQSTGGYAAREYLLERGLDAETIRRFRLGYAPDDREALLRMLKAEGVSEEEAAAAGLAIRPEGCSAYGRFRGRVMFPIRDTQSRVIAFGGRLLAKDAHAPKYLNSPETELFTKGQLLYNADLARRALRDTAAPVLLCEGYMDVIALAQFGLETALAPLGTALSAAQLQQLWALADEPVLCLDGDEAGLRAMRRAAETALPLLMPGKSLRFMTLPAGDDPDSLIRREGRAAFLEQVRRARPMVETLCGEVLSRPAETPEERAGQEQALLQMAERIEHQVVRAHYREHIRQRIWARKPAPSPKGGGAAVGGGMRRVRGIQSGTQQALRIPHLPGSGDLSSRKARAILRLFALLYSWPQQLNTPEAEGVLYDMAPEDAGLAQLQRILLAALEAPDHAAPPAIPEDGLSGALRARLTQEMQQLSTPPPDARQQARQWQQALAAWRQACLLEEYQQAERELARQMSAERFARFSALKEEMERLDDQLQRFRQEELYEEG